jgi:hypothetical protein
MPPQAEAEYLRERARRLREIASMETGISPDILDMAAELERRASALENAVIGADPPDDGQPVGARSQSRLGG